jgi:hypothetical protein
MMSLHLSTLVVQVAPAVADVGVALGVLLLLGQDDVLRVLLLPSRVRRVSVVSGGVAERDLDLLGGSPRIPPVRAGQRRVTGRSGLVIEMCKVK